MRARLALVLAALAAALAMAAPAAADDFVGMYSDDAFFGTTSYRTSVMAAEAATGVELIRQPFDWNRIETAPGEYDFRDYDDFVLRAAVYRIRLLPVLGDPPSFRALSSTSDDFWSPPNSNADFAAFAAKLVQRYGPNGTIWAAHPDVMPLPIRSWQVWNEPNLLMFWNTGPDAAAYTALLRAAGDAIHAADPGAEVVAAGLPDSRAGVPLEDFLDGMFGAGAHGAFDTMAVHPYAADAAHSIDIVERARSLLSAHGDSSPLWITEDGWPTAGPLSPFTVTEAQQAVNLRELIAGLSARRAELGVRGLVVFRWRDALSTFDAWPLHAGLVRADGTAKPGLAAFRDAVAALKIPATDSTDAASRDQSPTAQSPAAPPAVPPRAAPAAPTARVYIRGGELSRFGFLRVHIQCLAGRCDGRLRAGRLRPACSGRRRFALPAGAAVVRVRLEGTRKQIRRCTRVVVTATTGASDPPATAFLPKKAVRYAR